MHFFASSLLLFITYLEKDLHDLFSFSLLSDNADRSKFAKLFIGSVPRTATEEEVSHNCTSITTNFPPYGLSMLYACPNNYL